MNRPANRVVTLPIVTEVGVTPVWSWKADAGIGGVDEPLTTLLARVGRGAGGEKAGHQYQAHGDR